MYANVHEVIAGAAARSMDARQVPAALIERIHADHGSSVAAILLYGSFLRGQIDTVLDLYVILDNYRHGMPGRWHAIVNRLLPPNVYYIAADPSDGNGARAKYATVTLDHFERCVRRDFNCYFWARFSQPCAIIEARDEAVRARLLQIFSTAVHGYLARVLPLAPDEFSARDLWLKALNLSYRCEIRAEADPAGAFEVHGDYFASLTSAFADDRADVTRAGADRYLLAAGSPARQRTAAQLTWWLRKLQGKLISAARLVKCALTFNDALDYALWKIRRHSGVYIAPTERQRRHPLIFGWGLLWRVYRSGGFR